MIGKSRFVGTLKKSSFAGPNDSFPVQDRKHARLALQMVGRSERAGNISAAQASAIRGKAKAKLNARDAVLSRMKAGS